MTIQNGNDSCSVIVGGGIKYPILGFRQTDSLTEVEKGFECNFKHCLENQKIYFCTSLQKGVLIGGFVTTLITKNQLDKIPEDLRFNKGPIAGCCQVQLKRKSIRNGAIAVEELEKIDDDFELI
eukprot:Lithocolla_globosa_v1_NODE_897_length_3115_cov_8.205229.p2 type:complete len:124 gc:universal NODE_897_length_3115_cov_8.205229:887-516(-)